MIPETENEPVDGSDAPAPLEEFEKPVAKIRANAKAPDGKVKIRVLPKGDGKIATGHFDRQTNSFTYHAKGEHLFVHPTVAKEQEDNGLVEIIDGD